MKYFTDDVLIYDPFAPKEVQDAQDIKWAEAVQAYKVCLKGIEGRMLKGVYKFYTTKSLHDFDLISIQTREQSNKSLPVVIQLEIKKGDSILVLTYTNVLEFQVNYKTEISYRGFGCFVYDELLDLDDNFLSHEIMLSTDSSILIIFKNKCMKISELKK